MLVAQALESTGDDDDDDDDGEALQQVLAVLLASSSTKLRGICSSNGLDRQGPKSALVERLIDHIAAGMREQGHGP